MRTDPFADLPLPPDTLKAANAVRDRMSTWIDAQVTTLKTQMAGQAAVAATQAAAAAQQSLNQTLAAGDAELVQIENNLAALKATFTDPNLKAQSDKLQAAIDAHQAAVAAQKAELQKYGAMLGGLLHQELIAAL